MADPVGPLRQDTWSITVTIYKPGTDVVLIKGVWDKKDGGEVDSEDTIYHPGEMEAPVSLGGRRNVGNITLSRLCRIQRDWGVIPHLLAAAGKARVVVAQTPLDMDGHVAGAALVQNGKLKRVTPPPPDSEGTGAAMIEIEVSPDGYPA